MAGEAPAVGAPAPAAPVVETPAPAAPAVVAAPPAAPAAPPPPVAAAPVAPAAPPPVVVADNSPWLRGRLEQQARSTIAELLREAGASSVEEIKAAMKAAEDTNALRARLEHLEGDAKTNADREMAALTETHRAAVTGLLGDLGLKADDPISQLRAIAKLRPTWAATTSVAPTTTPTAPAAPASPATTAPPRAAPAPTTTTPEDHKTIWRDLQKTDPVRAAKYLKQHQRLIFPTQ
jgi:hypothetical protein